MSDGGMDISMDHGDHGHRLLVFDVAVWREVLEKEFPGIELEGDDPQEWLEALSHKKLQRAMKAMDEYAKEHTDNLAPGVGIDRSMSPEEMRDSMAAIVHGVAKSRGMKPGSLVPKQKKGKGKRAVHMAAIDPTQQKAQKAYQKKMKSFFDED